MARRCIGRPFAEEAGELARLRIAALPVPADYALWRLARRMNLDPDVIRGKPRSVILRWLHYTTADALYDDWRASETEFQMSKGRSN